MPQARSFIRRRLEKEKTIMLKRYQIVTNCLSELRNADISTIDRLQLEVALYRLKLVLLAEEEKLSGDGGDDPEFAGVIEMIHRICSLERKSIEVQKLIIHLNEVKEKILIRSGGNRLSSADATAR